jgi:iron complex outermembrane recepter protein
MNGNHLLSAWAHRSAWAVSASRAAKPLASPMIFIRSKGCAFFSAFIFLFLCGSSRGQTQPAPTDDETQHLEAFVVTGSNIPSAGEALAIPVAVISPSDISNSGVETNVLDVLRKISPAISGIGGENATIATGGQNGGSQVLVHNLPTLVLVNGRRMAYDPVDGSGGAEFVDLNAIPLAAIDRIEVLSDGSSAIYGADAIGGVINVILKKDYNGWEADVHYGYSDTTGHYSERSGSLTGGVSNGTTSITVSLEYTQTDPIVESERPYTNPFYATTYVPGILEVFGLTTNPSTPGYGYDEAFQLVQGVNAPPGGGSYTIQQLVSMGVYKDLGSFNNPGVLSSIEQIYNLATRQYLEQSLKRQSALVNIDHQIYGDKLESFGYMLFSHVDTESGLNAQPLFPFISDTNANLGNIGANPLPSGTEYVPVNAPTNPLSQASLDQGYADGSGGYSAYVHNRFEGSPRLFQDDDLALTFVGGLRGKISEDWSWEVAADISRYQDSYSNSGLLDTNNLIGAFVDGQINPFAINQAPGATNGVLGTAFVNYVSTNNTFDALLRGKLFDLPAGPVNFAAGFDLSRQNLTAVPDNNTANDLWVDSPTISPFNQSRSITSAYAEIEVPIVDKSHPLPGIYSMAFDAAGRYDDYSGNVGSSKVPKISLKYQPFDDEFTLRASAGKSFIAPQLFALYGPNSTGSSSQITYTGSNGVSYENVQFNAVTGSNPNLQPSTASTWDAGFVFTPKAVPNLSITADYFDTTQHNLISTIDENTIIQNVEDLGAASPYAVDVHFGSATGPGPSGDTPGQVSSRPLSSVYIIDNEVNIGAVAIKGYDASVVYALPTKGFGKFEFNSTITVYDSYLIQILPTQNYYQYAGHVSTIASNTENESSGGGEGGTIPRWKTYTSITWMDKGFELLVAQTFIPQVTDIGTGGADESPPLTVASYQQWDFALSYKMSALHWSHWTDGLRVRVGVNNAFNYEPPVAPYRLEDSLADVSTYDGAIGRMFYTDISYKF